MRHLLAALVALAALAGCSSSDDDPFDRAATTVPTTAVPSFEGDSESEFCAVTASFAGEQAPDPFAEGLDPVDVQIELRNATLRLERLVDVAPDEIADDLTTLLGGLLTLENQLRAFDFDLDRAVASGEEIAISANDPAFRDAGLRVQSYQQQVCDL